MSRPRSAAWIGRTLPTPWPRRPPARSAGTVRGTLVSRSLVAAVDQLPGGVEGPADDLADGAEAAERLELGSDDEAVEMERRVVVQPPDADKVDVGFGGELEDAGAPAACAALVALVRGEDAMTGSGIG